jgi:hypothetical protein
VCVVRIDCGWYCCGVFHLEGIDTHHLLVFADDVNILGGSTHTVRKNTEALVMANKEIRFEVRA